MSKPPIATRDLSPTLHISEFHACGEHKRGFWLYDDTREMNLSIGALTEEIALVEAIGYYQRRLIKFEKENKELKTKIENFINQFKDDDNIF